MSIMPEPMNEAEARLVEAGVQTGELDHIDLQGIARDYEAWIAESETYTAASIRQARNRGRRQEVAERAEELLVSLVRTEVQQTLENCDIDPLTLHDFIADAITVLERVRDGEVEVAG